MSTNLRFLLVFTLVSGATHRLHAQWVQTNGPYGGFVQSICFAGGSMYAGAGAVGGFRSTDSALHWTRFTVGPDNPWVSSFVGLGDKLFAVTNRGIYRSTNGETQWTLLDAPTSNPFLTLLPVGPSLFAGTESGVYRSSDSGTTWRATGSGGPGTPFYVLAASGSYLYAGICGGVLFSIDGGTSWAWGGFGLPQGQVGAFVPIGTDLYCGIHCRGIYQSRDHGISWTKISGNLPDSTVNTMVSLGTDLAVGTDQGVYFSSNSGTTWRASSLGWKYPRVAQLLAVGSTLYAVALGIGVYASSDKGMTWYPMNTGLTATTVESLTPCGPYLFAGTPGSGLFRSSDAGTSWEFLDDGSRGEDIFDFAVSGTTLYLARSGGIFRSSDYGVHWQPAGVGSGRTPLSLTLIGQTIVAASNDTVFRSTDGGASWAPASSGLLSDTYIVRSSGSSVYAGGAGIGYVFRSLDTAKSWQDVGRRGWYPKSFAFNGSSVLVGMWNGVALSTDGGTSWAPVDPRYDSHGFFNLVASGPIVFAVTSPTGPVEPRGDSIMVSTDFGVTWKPAVTGMDVRHVASLAISGDEVYAGTQGFGVWRRALKEMTTAVAPPSNSIPRQFHLDQNYPNPFNPTTTIRYELPQEAKVSLKVYDVLGREVMTLAEGVQRGGRYSVELQGHDLASGIYFYRLQAGTFTQSRAMCLMR